MKHVSVYARFNLKGSRRPGLTSEDWTIAKDNPLTFDVLIAVIAARLAEFYLNTGGVGVDEMNESIQKASKQIATIWFEENKNGIEAESAPMLPGLDL